MGAAGRGGAGWGGGGAVGAEFLACLYSGPNKARIAGPDQDVEEAWREG